MGSPGSAPTRRFQRLPLASVFVGAVAVCGSAVVLHSAWGLWTGTAPAEWLLFAILTVLSGTLSLKIPSIQSRFSVSEVFAFTSVLLFGPDVGALILALDGLRISLLWKMNRAQTLFNFGNLGLSIWAAGSVFFAVGGVRPLFGQPAPSANVLLYLTLMTATYFLLNTVLTATAIALSSGRSIVAVWREHYWTLFPSYFAGASVAFLLVLAFHEVQFTAIALIVPLLVICYLTVRSSFGRVEDTKRHVEELNRLLLSTVETLATAIDAKDEVTHDHVRRVQQGTLALARELGVADVDALKAIEAAALLHDTGKIAIPEHILNKPGRLTAAEFEKMKKHAPIGAQILSSIDFPYPVVPIVRHHHENWDGTGYPDGLKGETIPLGARILSVVDCFDALTSDRPYRRRMTDEQALGIITDRRGTMYDPLVVDTFVAAYRRIMPEADAMPHPAGQVVGEARAQRDTPSRIQSEPPPDSAIGDEVLAIMSLSHALAGGADLDDAGSLLWMILRQIVPSDAMAIFLPDGPMDAVIARYAAGSHASEIRGVSRPTGSGIAGWVAVQHTTAANADPALDLGFRVAEAPALRACLAVPLLEADALVAVLTLYSSSQNAFSNDHVRLLELLAPRLANLLLDAVIADEDQHAPQPARASSLASLKLVKSR